MRLKSSRCLKIEKYQLFFLLSLWLLVHIFLFSTFGVRDYFVDSRRYFEMSDYFLTHGNFEFFHHIFYSFPVLLLLLFRLLFSDAGVAFVFFQAVFSGVATLALYRSASLVFRNCHAGFFAAVIFLLWIDCIQWNTAVMTESVASSLICLVIYQLTHYRDALSAHITLVVLVALSLLTRPTGVLVCLGVATFLLTRYWNAFKKPSTKFLVIGVLGAVACFCAFFMLNQWDFTDQYEKGNIVTYMDTIEGQLHYHDNLRLETSELILSDLEKPPFEKLVFFVFHNPVHFVQAGTLKVFYLVSGFRPYFSTLHNLYTIVWVSFAYFLFYAGYRCVQDKPVRNFCLALVIGNCLLISVSAVDWDNRFFLPMQPGIVLLAGGGAAHFLRKVGTRVRCLPQFRED